MSQMLRIVYPGNDRTKLALALVWDYEEDQYDLASTESWSPEERPQAEAYCRQLATKHGLALDGVPALLDADQPPASGGMNLDFHTANAAEEPHVSVYDVDTEQVVCRIPIHDTGDDEADIGRAEQIAACVMDALKGFVYVPPAQGRG